MRKTMRRYGRTIAAALMVTTTVLVLGGCGSGSTMPTANQGNAIETDVQRGQNGAALITISGTGENGSKTVTFTVPADADSLLLNAEGQTSGSLVYTLTAPNSTRPLASLNNGQADLGGLAASPTDTPVTRALGKALEDYVGEAPAEMTDAEIEAMATRLKAEPIPEELQQLAERRWDEIPVNSGRPSSGRQEDSIPGNLLVLKPQPGEWTLTVEVEGVKTHFLGQLLVWPKAGIDESGFNEMLRNSGVSATSRGWWGNSFVRWVYNRIQNAMLANLWDGIWIILTSPPPFNYVAATVVWLAKAYGAWVALNWLRNQLISRDAETVAWLNPVPTINHDRSDPVGRRMVA